jgi:hypothetical protein
VTTSKPIAKLGKDYGYTSVIKNYGLEGKEEAPLVIDLAAKLFSGINSSEYSCINLCGIQPYTRRKREIDFLMLVDFDDKSKLREHRVSIDIEDARRVKTRAGELLNQDIRRGHRVFLRTVTATIEIKQHSAQNIEIRGDDLYVRYNKRWEPATSKFIQQATTCKQFLKNNAKSEVFNINTFVYLPNVKKVDLAPRITSRQLRYAILYADSDVHEFIEGCIYQEGVFALEQWNYSTLGNSQFDFKKCEVELDRFYSGLRPGSLEQEKLELIGKKYVDQNKVWVRSLGEKMIAFTGLAGTGKTLKLLRASNDLLEDYSDPVLFLTFNRALARDLERLMQLQNLGSGSRITVWTIDQFLFKLAHRFGLYEDFNSFIKEYRDDAAYDEIRELVLEGVTSGNTAQKIRDTLLREFTYVAIDEGQDWFQVERDIILSIFGPSNIILAAGTDQCLRAPALANWKQDVKRLGADVEIVNSRKSLRQTSNINKFNNVLADKLELDWSLESNPELMGGDIYLFDELNEEVIQEFFAELREGKCKYYPIDYLVMTSPSSKTPVLDQVVKQGYSVWDGISEEDRDSVPLQSQIRCVSTHSCRGLEGWSTLILDLDRWLQFAINRSRAIIEEKDMPTFFEMEYLREDPSIDDFRFLPKWFLIPFTRAKNKMFIELPTASRMREVLLEAASENPDFIHRIK